MKMELRRPSFALAVCIAALSIAGCSSSPGIDGGIVGSGNRIDCAALAKKERPDATLPADCRP